VLLTFDLFRFPVLVHPTFFLMSVLLAWDRWSQPAFLLSGVVVVGLSLLIHELGHALAYRRFGHDARITLYAMGGLTQSTKGELLAPWQEIIVCLAGPAFGFIAAAVVYAVYRLASVPPEAFGARLVLFDLLWVNGFWSVLNLLPILPLDGGQALRALLWYRWKERTENVVIAVSTVVATVGASVAGYFGLPWAAFLALCFAIGNGRAWQLRRDAQEAATVSEVLAPGFDAFEGGDAAKAIALAEAALSRSRSRSWCDRSLTLLALARLKAGDFDGARAAVAQMRAYAVETELLVLLEKGFGDAGLAKEAEETARLRREREAAAASRAPGATKIP
jgi:stage IV sporulation protein FB